MNDARSHWREVSIHLALIVATGGVSLVSTALVDPADQNATIMEIHFRVIGRFELGRLKLLNRHVVRWCQAVGSDLKSKGK